jgi:hypothetical protein
MIGYRLGTTEPQVATEDVRRNPVASEPITTPGRRRWSRRRKTVVGAVAAVLLFCGIPMPWTVSGAINAAVQRGVGGVATPAHPGAATCAAILKANQAPPVGHADPRGTLRVIGIQYKMDISHANSYGTYRNAMRCLMERYVVPYQKPGVPTLVVFPEDVGLETIAIGQRGEAARVQARSPMRAPAGDSGTAGIGTALLGLNAAYAPQVAAYQLKFHGVDPRKEVLLAATDTFVRAFSTTFSDIARDYGVYVVAANNQAPYRETHNPAEVALYGDPTASTGVAYVATKDFVANTTFLWGPTAVHPDAPDGERNLVFSNEKVPLTDMEKNILGLDEGPSSGPAAITNAAGHVVAGFRLGFATSLPAFTYGYDFGRSAPGGDPCADTEKTYAACMNAHGVQVVIQAEANPGRWTGPGGTSDWQPLEWMGSTWRTVADPTVAFKYNVTAMMTGSLLDMTFDGQSAITERDASETPQHYVGAGTLQPGDPANISAYAGAKPEFLALAPWVTPDGTRAALAATGAHLAAGSGDRLENAYLETAVWADLVPG